MIYYDIMTEKSYQIFKSLQEQWMCCENKKERQE